MKKNIRNPIRSVLFDMDNTLFDFVRAQQAACRAVLLHCGHDGKDGDLFSYFRRPVHGFEHHDNVRDFLLDQGAFSERLLAECCEIYEREKVAAVQPYAGIPEILTTLQKRGRPLGIITDAETGNAAKRLFRAGLSPFFSVVISPDIAGARKPDSAPFLLALKKLQAVPEETVFVGDSIRRDIAPAKRIGIVTVYAQYGDWSGAGMENACTPDYVARSITEMESVLSRLTGS